ncbi:DNA polymerase III subunit delta [Clostridium acetireducens DSM 10703]|jgi:DNA polymerase-3 subunit delta|uniref:DNA polymerase III subunit delta n=1 Tax=Clostridium acetireducens DSM 10703 TaxID=1121290 RepID=A0A1E8F162_9CLOT|nr:DNA polymerase III subunit delta [Clostridium acetireducens]OFI07201.1 DNA polymerase III subunit delta [Clostridium acetireducens DSM 10703]
MNISELHKNLNKNNIENCYILFGKDENLIKSNINIILNKILDKNFKDLNYTEFDGNTLEDIEEIKNACETVPFMSNKRVVCVYRANFLKHKNKSIKKNELNKNTKESNESDENNKVFNDLKEYIKSIPSHCVLILYYAFQDKREKVSSNIYKLNKNACIVEVSFDEEGVKYKRKYKENQIKNEIKKFFNNRNKDIGKVELENFYIYVKDYNLGVIENEVEKLCCYAFQRDITKEDIKIMFFKRSNDDIFDLINFIFNKNVVKSIRSLNEILLKGQKIESIVPIISSHLRKMLHIKIAVEKGKNKHTISKELNLHPYACEVIINQCKRFTLKQIEDAIKFSINCDENIKNQYIEYKDKKLELEILILKIISNNGKINNRP